MKVRALLLRVLVLLSSMVALALAVGCAGPIPGAAVQPAAAKEIEQAEVFIPTPAPASATALPTKTPQPIPTETLTPIPSHTPTATITASPTPRPGLPVLLRIPAIGVDAYVEHVGLTEELAMDVPSKVGDVAWYELGYRPGERGSAVIAGHLDTVTGAPAVFWDVEKLEPGDEIFIHSEDGVEHRFVVDYRTRYPYNEAPIQQIFGPATEPRLALITCNGVWDRTKGNYSHRVVVYATAAQADQN